MLKNKEDSRFYKYDEILEQLKPIVVEQLGVDINKVIEEANFVNDLGADSLDTVELVMAIEEYFKIDIPDEKAESITTVRQAVEFIHAHLKSV